MKRAIVTHRQDFIAILALFAAAIAVVGYILEHQPSFTFDQSYYTVKAEFATRFRRRRRAGTVGRRRRRPGRTGRRCPAPGRPRGRDDEHLQAVRADLPGRDRAAAPPHAVEGHVPVARPGNQAGGGSPQRGDAPGGEHAARRRRRPDPLLAGRRHARLPAAAAGRRGPGLPRSRAPRARLRAPTPSPICAGRSSGSRRSTATRRRSRNCSPCASRTSAGRFTTCSW